jgi:hypothetical protein
MGGKGDRPAGLENRWWVDQQRDAQGYLIDRPRIPLRFFRSAAGFDQDTAQRRLTDLNLKWFNEVETRPGEWALIRTLENQRVPEPRLRKVQGLLPVPPGCRGVLVDSGEALRAIVTGTPLGDRLVEVRIGVESSFDAWVGGEWVREVLFRNADDALRRAPRLVREYLTTARGAPIS